MGDNKTPDLPVQIIKANGGPPLAVVPLPFLLALIGIARQEVERAENEADRERLFRRTVKQASVFAADDSKAAQHLRNLFAHMTKEDLSENTLAAVLYRGLSEGRVDYRHDTHMIFEEKNENADDREAYLEAKARDEEVLPLAVVKRLAAGEHPVKVFREHRRLTQAELAEAAGTTSAYLSQIETGKRGGSKKLLRGLADALEVELADLLD